MATPEIGSTISAAYSNGFERLSKHAPAALVPAVILGVIVGALTQLQIELVPDVGDVLEAIFSGDGNPLSTADVAKINLIGAVSTAIQIVFVFAAGAIFAGAYYVAERDGVDADIPEPAGVMGKIAEMAASLMPKLGIIVGLAVAGSVLGIVSSLLGGLVMLVAGIALIYLGIQWIYAPVIAGSGDAEGDAAFERSAQVVSGCWWPTLGVWIVITVAIYLPVGIVAAILGAIMPGTFLSSTASTVISTLGALTLGASAYASAWTQIGAQEAGESAQPMQPPSGATYTPPAAPAAPQAPAYTPPTPYAPPVGTPPVAEPASPAAPAPVEPAPPTEHPTGDQSDSDPRGPFV